MAESKSPAIVVVGSSNTDMVVHTESLPKPGETILGGEFLMNPGGKGANQAVAAAKLGGEVTFITKVGNDVFGQEAVKGFQQLNIDVSHVVTDEDHPSGVALIMVDHAGENCIAVAPGANGAMRTSEIDTAQEAIAKASFLLMQLEIPLEVVGHAQHMATGAGVKVILNPAPAQSLPNAVFQSLFMITPNETEAELLTGVKVTDIDSAREAAEVFQQKGVETVIITMGSQGAYVKSEQYDELVPSPEVTAIDTTAAGDCFNGALTVALAEGMNLLDSIRFANAAASLSTTRKGAQASVPLRSEVN